MADNINLLPEQKVTESPAARQNTLVNQVSAGVLAVTILATAAVFGINFYLERQVDSLDNDILAKESQVNEFRNTEGVYRSVVARVQGAQEFVSTQRKYSRLLGEVGKAVPGGLRFTEMSIRDGSSVVISGLATSYADISGFQAKLETIADSEVDVQYFENPIVRSISRHEESEMIQFGLTFDVSPRLISGGDN